MRTAYSTGALSFRSESLRRELHPAPTNDQLVVVLHDLVAGHHVLVAPDHLGVIAREHVRMNHPAEHFLVKPAARGIAFLARSDSQGSEYRATISLLRPARVAAFWRKTPVHVLMPLRGAEWYTFVELVRGKSLGRGVHRSDQHEIAHRILLIEK